MGVQLVDERPGAVAVLDPHTGLGGAELAAKYGMSVSGKRPPLIKYTRELWSRRFFIASFANAKLTAVYTTAKLGQVWQILTPILNAAVYYLIFGVIIGTSRGIPHFIAFLTCGVFLYSFTQLTVTAGTRAIADNLNLIRALHFPRACMPIAVMLTQFQQLFFSVIALLVIVMLNGKELTLHAFALLPVLFLQAFFNGGLALIFARVGAKNTDMAQVMPFVLRTWMYLSGVLYDIHSLTKLSKGLRTLLALNPMAIFIDLARQSLGLLKPHTVLPAHVWLMAAGWALVIGVGGYVWFWKAEEEYGRG
jgi:teichoic acid transport system permease protein